MSMAGVKLFDHLKEACAWEWNRYIRHEFVGRLGDGTLPESAFRHYLQQDYLFLIHFARAYALAGYKAALSLGYTRSIGEVYAAAGIRFDFSPQYISSLADFVREEMAQL